MDEENSWEYEENSWVIEVTGKVNNLSKITSDEKVAWERHSIYKLPACVTDLVTDRKESVYKPRATSFGPYHHGKSCLNPMEAHKERALLHFLKRSGKTLDFYIQELSIVMQELKDAYDSLDKKWERDSEGFLKLMIRDGCFMIEALRTSSSTDLTKNGYASNDPIFSKHGCTYMMPYIKRDMLMLENQLPMLLLRKLHAIYKLNLQLASEESIDSLIFKFYPHCHSSNPPKLDNCLHVLDAFRTILLWGGPDNQNQVHCNVTVENDDAEILSARELEESGIQIQQSHTRSLNDIQFNCKSGILKLPQLWVDDVSETMFLNLIAFERFHAGAGSQVTEYIYLMDKLIDNANDVNILQRHEVLHNALGSDKAVAHLFNSLSKDVVLDREGSLTAVHVAINSYCKTRWHKWRASLIHTYFRNPWAAVSVFAAIVLFGLTIIQAVYGALQFYQGQKS